MVLDKLGENLSQIMRKVRGLAIVDKETIKALLQQLQRSLLQADVKVELVFEVTNRIEKRAFDQIINKKLKRKDFIVKILHDELIGLLGGKAAPQRLKTGKTSIILLIGIQGSGKTTTIGKLARHYSAKGMKVAVINTDTWRPGAFHQLKQHLESVPGKGIDYFGMENEKNPFKILQRGMKKFTKVDDKKEIIIVDTAGRHKEEKGLMDEMKKMERTLKPNETILVIDGTLGQQAYSQAKAFSDNTNVGSIIITKLDGSAKGGGALSAAAACNAPIRFIGVGERVKDLEEFNPTSFVGTLLGIPDIEGLVKKVEELGIEPDDEQVKRIMQGKFTLDDVYEQLKALKKMGSFKKILGMMGGKAIPAQFQDMAEENLDSWKIVIDSCTMDERINPEIIKRTRIKRIAIGSGKSYTTIKKMLDQYKQMKGMIKKMMGANRMSKRGGQGRGGGGGDGGMPGMPGAGGFDMAQMQKMMQQQKGGGKRKKRPW